MICTYIWIYISTKEDSFYIGDSVMFGWLVYTKIFEMIFWKSWCTWLLLLNLLEKKCWPKSFKIHVVIDLRFFYIIYLNDPHMKSHIVVWHHNCFKSLKSAIKTGWMNFQIPAKTIIIYKCDDANFQLFFRDLVESRGIFTIKHLLL